MAVEGELSRIDEEILRYADSMSPEEISQRWNGVIEPEQVAARTKQLLKSRKWLTQAQEEELVLLRLRNTLTMIEKAMSDSGMIDLDTAMVQLRFLKELGNRLDKRRAATQVDLETYDMNVARQLGRVLDLTIESLRRTFISEIDEDLWDAAVQRSIAQARDILEEKAVAE